MLKLINAHRRYDWGSFDEIPRFLGAPIEPQPLAEVWMGTHPLDPSYVARDDTQVPLADVAGELPYLVKILAARQPLSIQVHPTKEDAAAGFAAEEAAGIPLDAPERTYKDANHKPEMMYALTTFDTLVGFRPTAEIFRVLAPIEAEYTQRLAEQLQETPGFSGIVRLVEAILSHPPTSTELDYIAVKCADLLRQGIDVKRAYATAVEVASIHPHDPGVLISLLLNRLTLQPGEAAYLGAGVIHAHLKGMGLEIMATSDNVLRAGLTSKHLDPTGLVKTLDTGMSRVARVTPQMAGPTTDIFAPGAEDFALSITQVSRGEPVGVDLPAAGRRILVCTGGDVVVTTESSEKVELHRGEAVYVTPEDGVVNVAGTGELAQAFEPRTLATTSELVDLV